MKPEDWGRYLENLRALPFVKAANILAARPEDGEGAMPADAVIEVRTPGETHRLLVEIKLTHLTYALVEGLLARIERNAGGLPWMIVAPHVGRKMAALLIKRRANFLDQAGNCYLTLDDRYMAIIEGRPPLRRAPRGRGLGLAGYQVLFAILVDPDLLNVPTRQLAEQAGTGKTAAANTLRRLEEEGLVGKGVRKRHLLKRERTLEQWTAGYANLVRPRLLLGKYRTVDTTHAALEDRIERELADQEGWAWGGGTAAMRLNAFYRGMTTTLHVDRNQVGLVRLIGAIPDRNGNLEVMLLPARIALRGAIPRTVHPLLVYTELLATNDERTLEAATKIREQYLDDT